MARRHQGDCACREMSSMFWQPDSCLKGPVLIQPKPERAAFERMVGDLFDFRGR